MGVLPSVGLYSPRGTPDERGARDNDPLGDPSRSILGGLPEVQKNAVRGAMKKARFGTTVGTIWMEIPITERLMGLPYEDLKAIILDDAKIEAENALHQAMHYRCGFECAGYVVPEG